MICFLFLFCFLSFAGVFVWRAHSKMEKKYAYLFLNCVCFYSFIWFLIEIRLGVNSKAMRGVIVALFSFKRL